VAYEPLQDITLLVNNIKLSCMIITTNTATHLQLQQLCSQKQNCGGVLYFTMAQNSTIPL
jgi:hypothetical protein